MKCILKGEENKSTGIAVMKRKSRWRDSNPRPADYESAALPLSHSGRFPCTFVLEDD
jgi:hypothetical protein